MNKFSYDKRGALVSLTISCELRGVRGADLWNDEDAKEHCKTTHRSQAQKWSAAACLWS